MTPHYTRRDFLRIASALTAGAGLGPGATTALAKGLERIFKRQKRVIWLQGMSCSGCSVSLLNTEDPGPLEVLTRVISLVVHPTVAAAQGAQVAEAVQKATKEGEYFLVLEGSIPLRISHACMIGGQPFTTLLDSALSRAEYAIGAGSCAAYGGIPAAEGNQTGAVGLVEYMKKRGMEVKNRVVNCPGCPSHPQTLITVLAHLAGVGYPKVDPVLFTPDIICKNSVHDECPKFHFWQKGQFATKFGDEGCLFKLGCLGPLSHSNCPQRQWNGGVNWCIRAGAPCIGCTSEQFSKRRSFPFYRNGEAYHAVAYGENERKGVAT